MISEIEGVAEIPVSGQNELTWIIWGLSVILSENWGSSKYQSGREFPKLSDKWLNSRFKIKWKTYDCQKLKVFLDMISG
jgi:hypothetical protein